MVGRTPANADPAEHGRGRLRPRRLLGALAVWLAMVLVAILNATIRELFITPNAGDYLAHVASTITLVVALAVVIVLYLRRVPDHASIELAAIGVLWAGLTVAFELLFGHYVAGESWAALLALYDVTAGYVWAFVPLFLLLAPLLLGRRLQD